MFQEGKKIPSEIWLICGSSSRKQPSFILKPIEWDHLDELKE
jgi:hypothetical protein